MQRMLGALVIGLLFCTVVYAHPINMKALAQIESSNNPKAYNKKTQARGLYQITPVVLKQFTEAHPKNWKSQEDNRKVARDLRPEELFIEYINGEIADWYVNWLSHRCYVPDDILISWNWGYGHWRKWANNRGNENWLPKETRDFLKKYHDLTETI
jgi:hypothetical protein